MQTQPQADTTDKDPVTRAAKQEYTEHYTSEDRMAVRTITAMLGSAGLSQAQLAGMAGCSEGTVSQVLTGRLPRSPSEWLAIYRQRIDRYMGHDLELAALDSAAVSSEPIDAPFVATSVYRAVAAACYRARRYGGFGVVAAFVGTGKTTAIERIAAEQEDVYVIHGLPGMTHSILLDELVKQVGCPVKSGAATGGTKAEKLRALITALKGRRALIILDEAETCSPSTLEYLRRIRDLAQAGVVLCGTEKLMPMVRDPRGRFGQISSRVLYWPPIIRRCSADDIRALAEACMPDVALDAELLRALEVACDGSARVLCDGVLPGLRDYGLGKGHQLTAALIQKISRDLLGFTPAARRKQA